MSEPLYDLWYSHGRGQVWFRKGSYTSQHEAMAEIEKLEESGINFWQLERVQ